MTTPLPRVAFLGMGTMGRHMATNLARAGYPVTVWNRTPGRDSAPLASGARRAEVLADAIRGADVVCACVTDSAAVASLVRGRGGLLEAGRPGMSFVDHSTISPTVTRELAAAVETAGMSYLDAPVTGGETGARDATLTIMVGGDAATFRRIEPLLGAMGRRIVHVGPVGSGQTMKLVANLIGGVTIAGSIEGLALGAKAGLDLATMLDVLVHSSASSAFLQNASGRLIEGNYTPGFSLSNRTKDFTLALDTARESGVPLPVTALVRELFASLVEELGSLDQSAYVKLMERLAGIRI